MRTGSVGTWALGVAFQLARRRGDGWWAFATRAVRLIADGEGERMTSALGPPGNRVSGATYRGRGMRSLGGRESKGA